MKYLLQAYEGAFGQAINFSKSGIFSAKTCLLSSKTPYQIHLESLILLILDGI